MAELYVKPGNQERGWNDPPQFSYGLQAQAGGARRTPLTRRAPPPPAGAPPELQQQQWDAADEIHRSLMVDHVNEVSQWLVGVKRLIAEMRSLPALKPAAATDGSAEAGPA